MCVTWEAYKDCFFFFHGSNKNNFNSLPMWEHGTQVNVKAITRLKVNLSVLILSSENASWKKKTTQDSKNSIRYTPHTRGRKFSGQMRLKCNFLAIRRNTTTFLGANLNRPSPWEHHTRIEARWWQHHTVGMSFIKKNWTRHWILNNFKGNPIPVCQRFKTGTEVHLPAGHTAKSALKQVKIETFIWPSQSPDLTSTVYRLHVLKIVANQHNPFGAVLPWRLIDIIPNGCNCNKRWLLQIIALELKPNRKENTVLGLHFPKQTFIQCGSSVCVLVSGF